jgi:antitoxin (DNA-binding transcriptional repressor) of toxin-antitoxin stability system
VEPTVINATDLRIKTREIMERVKFKGECFLIKTFGQPTAMIISVEKYTEITGKTLAQSENSLKEPSVAGGKDTGKV